MCRHRLLKLLIRVQHSSELLIKVNICPRLEDNPSLLRDAGVEYSLLSPDLPATQHSSLRWKQYPHRNYPLVKQQTGIIDFLTRQNILYNMMRCLIRILYFPNVHYIFLIFFYIFAWKRNVKQSLFARLLSRNSFKGFYPTVTTLLFGSCLFLAQHGTLLETIIKWKAVMKGSPTVNRLNQIRELLTISVAVQTANTILKLNLEAKINEVCLIFCWEEIIKLVFWATLLFRQNFATFCPSCLQVYPAPAQLYHLIINTSPFYISPPSRPVASTSG